MSDSAHAQVRDALMAFVRAFERGDTRAMREAFAEDATSFPRSAANHPGTPDRCMLAHGIDPEMLAAVEAAKAAGAAPPYVTIEPRDLDVRVSGDMALVTFHLVSDVEIGRRTFVLLREAGAWKILHTHASNVGVRSAGDQTSPA